MYLWRVYYALSIIKTIDWAKFHTPLNKLSIEDKLERKRRNENAGFKVGVLMWACALSLSPCGRSRVGTARIMEVLEDAQMTAPWRASNTEANLTGTQLRGASLVSAPATRVSLSFQGAQSGLRFQGLFFQLFFLASPCPFYLEREKKKKKVFEATGELKRRTTGWAPQREEISIPFSLVVCASCWLAAHVSGRATLECRSHLVCWKWS